MQFALAQSPAVCSPIANLQSASLKIRSESHIPDDLRALLYDPQTSGGLLISVASENAPELLASSCRMPAFRPPSSDGSRRPLPRALADRPLFCDDEVL